MRDWPWHEWPALTSGGGPLAAPQPQSHQVAETATAWRVGIHRSSIKCVPLMLAGGEPCVKKRPRYDPASALVFRPRQAWARKLARWQGRRDGARIIGNCSKNIGAGARYSRISVGSDQNGAERHSDGQRPSARWHYHATILVF